MVVDCAITNCFDTLSFDPEEDAWVHSGTNSVYCFVSDLNVDEGADYDWMYATATPVGYTRTFNGWEKIQPSTYPGITVCIQPGCGKTIFQHNNGTWLHEDGTTVYCFSITAAISRARRHSKAKPGKIHVVENSEDVGIPRNNQLLKDPENIQVSENPKNIQLSNDSQIGENSMHRGNEKEIQIGKHSNVRFTSSQVYITDEDNDVVMLEADEAVLIANEIISRAQSNVVFNVE